MSHIISTEPSAPVVLDIGTTPIINGVGARVLFESGANTLYEDNNFQFDPNNGKLTANFFSALTGKVIFPTGGLQENLLNPSHRIEVLSSGLDTPILNAGNLEFTQSCAVAGAVLGGTTTILTDAAYNIPVGSYFIINRRTLGTLPGHLAVVRNSQTSFTITSSSATDNGVVSVIWFSRV